MKISVLCDSIQATQTISFCFDQSFLPLERRISFAIHQWNDLKRLDQTTRYKLLFDCDYLILSRWYRPESFGKIFHEARRRSKKVFLHLDDFLFAVPKSIGVDKWRHYSSKKMSSALLRVADLSDGIIASTDRLEQEIKKILPGVKVFTCPFYKQFRSTYKDIKEVFKRTYPTIGYMGTQSHAEDLELVSPALDYLMSRNHTLVFETFGIQVPEMLRKKYPIRCSTLKKVDNYEQFQEFLTSRGWWIGLAPLVESQFNYCKANTKFIEYIQAGIPVASSNYGPYKGAPSIENKHQDFTSDTWINQIRTILVSRKQRAYLHENQLEYCKKFSDPILLVDFYRKIVA